MNVESIGASAGLVWKALDEAVVLGVKQLRTITKLKEKEVYAAIGWLAREGKVTLQPSDTDAKEIIVTLIQDK